MGVVQRTGKFADKIDGLVHRKAPSGFQNLPNGGTGNELTGDVVTTFRDSTVKHLCNVGVSKSGSGACFAKKSLLIVLGQQDLAMGNLEGDVAVQLGVVGAKDAAEATLAEQRDQFVAAYRFAVGVGGGRCALWRRSTERRTTGSERVMLENG